MSNQYSHDIKQAIAELQETARKYQQTKELTADLLAKAAEDTHRLIHRLNDLSITAENKLLRELYTNLLFVVTQLHNVALREESKATPPPHELLANVTSSFEIFFNKSMSKKVQGVFKSAAAFVPTVAGVVHCCETMPYYWTYASRNEKAGLILGLTLIVAALALTIASYASPAIAGMFVLGFAISTMCTVGTFLYKNIINSPKKKYDDLAKLKSTVKSLSEQKDGVMIMAKKVFVENKLAKNELLFQEKYNISDKKPKKFGGLKLPGKAKKSAIDPIKPKGRKNTLMEIRFPEKSQDNSTGNQLRQSSSSTWL